MQKPSTPTTKINVGANGAVTATQTSSKINAGGYGVAAKAFLNITAISGTSATLTVKFQDSPTGAAGSWTDVASGAFSAQTATGLNSLVLANVGPYLQAVQTVSGTTPSITYDLSISGLN